MRPCCTVLLSLCHCALHGLSMPRPFTTAEDAGRDRSPRRAASWSSLTREASEAVERDAAQGAFTRQPARLAPGPVSSVLAPGVNLWRPADVMYSVEVYRGWDRRTMEVRCGRAGLQAGEITAAVSGILRFPEASLRVHFKLMGDMGYALQPCSPLERFAPGSRVLVTSTPPGVAAPRP